MCRGWFFLCLPRSSDVRSAFSTGKSLFRWRLTALLAAVVCLGAAGAQAATCTVSSTADTNTSGTLRYCLNNYRSGDTIELSVTGTITLTSALPAISTNLTITGPGASSLAVSGVNQYEIFSIDSGATVSISGLTIEDGVGTSAGGIQNNGTLTVTNCVFTGNAAPGQLGGAINSAGSLTVTGSTFTGNSAEAGGAIHATDTVTVTDSAFYNNSATESAGAILLNGDQAATLADSTFYGNTAKFYGGAIESGAPLTATNNTFSGNSAAGNSSQGQGGAIYNVSTSSGSLVSYNNIFSGNTAKVSSGGGGIFNQSGATVTAVEYNVFYQNLAAGSEDDAEGFTLDSTNQNGSDPKLMPLGYYGGTTETMLPAPGSAAICLGSASLASAASLSADQRGFAMNPAYTSCPSGSVDAGAVQTNYIEVQASGDTGSGSPDCQGVSCTLRDAIALANSNGYGDIDFASGVSSITLSSGLSLSGATGINIIGPGANQLTVNGGGSSSNFSVFSINSGAMATLYGLTVGNGNSSSGAGVYNFGRLAVLASAISGNTATTSGGGILNSGGTLTLTDSTVSSNHASLDGGGIVNLNNSTLTLIDSTVSGNVALSSANGYGDGGGILNDVGSKLTLTNSTVSANLAECSGCTNSAQGGGIDVVSGTLTASNSIVAGNTTQGTLGSDDCDGTCPSNATNGNMIGGTPELSPLQYNGIGATVQTMIPLPGSPAICAGLASDIPSGTTTDERGYPLQPTSGYCSSTQVDSGAVQTNYTSMEFVQQPTNVAVNTAMLPAPTVQVLETDTLLSAPNNTDGVNGIPLVLTLTSGTMTGGSATTSGSGNNAGTATFSGIQISSPEQNDQLNLPQVTLGTATMGPVASSNFDVIGAATQLAVSATSPVTAGGASSVQVTAEDSAGNTVSGDTDTVNVTITGSPTVLATMTLSAGTRTSNVTLTTAGSYTLTATDTTNSSITGVSNTITVNPAATATQIVVAGYPSTVFAGVPETGTITVEDQYGNTETAYSGSATLTTSDGSATVTTPVTITNGVGTFAVTFATTGTQSITAAIAGLPSGHETGIRVDPIPNYVVETKADDASGVATNCPAGGGGTTCTLRDALAAAAAGAGNITFDATAFGSAQTITLTSAGGTLNLPANTTITGPTTGSGSTLTNLVTIDGGGSAVGVSIFTVATGVTGADLANLNLTDGAGDDTGGGDLVGGAIYNSGALTVTGCTFSGNTASGTAGAGGAVDNAGNLTITNSTFTGNTATDVGGAISESTGTLTISGSTFSGNTAGANGNAGGGAIFIQAKTLGTTGSITNSTFVNNTAPAGIGGAVYAQVKGVFTIGGSTFSGNSANGAGALYFQGADGTSAIQYSTFTGNTATGSGAGSGTGDGGAISTNPISILVIDSVTITGNTASAGGGGIYANIQPGSYSVTLTNTLVGGNSASTYADVDNLGPGAFNTDSSDLLNAGSSGTSSITPNLSALGNYGGPTETMIPLPGSPAICAGSYSEAQSAGISTDQRGVSFGSTGAGGYCPSGSIDVGAVQTDYALSFSGEPGTPQVSGLAFNAAVSLTENGLPVSGVNIAVTASAGTLMNSPVVTTSGGDGKPNYSLTITSATPLSGVTLTAALPSPPTLTATSSAFDLDEPAPTSLTPSVTPGTTFVFDQQPTISVAVTPSAATGTLAATLDSSTSLTVTPGSGGNFSIALPGTPLTVGSHTIALAFTGMGAYESSTGSISLTVTTPSFVVNTTADDATGTASNCTSAGTCTLRDALAAASVAGAGNITFDGTVFASAQTITLGSGGTLSVPTNTTITGPGANKLTISGANSYLVFSISSGNVNLSGLTVANGSNANAGGLWDNSNGTVIISQCAFVNNTSTGGFNAGAIVFGGSGTMDVEDSTFIGNSDTTSSSSGAITSASSTNTLNVVNSTFYNNNGPFGGAIGNDNGPMTVVNSTFYNNSGSVAEAIYASGTSTIANNIFVNNTAGPAAVAGNDPQTTLDGNVYWNNAGGDCFNCTSAGTVVTSAAGGIDATSNPLTLPLGYYGGTTQTYLPQPGSAAICAGSYSDAQSAGIGTDQRGVSFGNTGAGGYCASGSIDAGAVQADYTLNFNAGEPGTPQVSGVSFPVAVALEENGNLFTAAAETIPLALTDPSAATLTGGSATTSGGVAAYSLTATNPTAVTGLQLGASLTLNGTAAATATSTPFDLNEPAPTVTLASANFTVPWSANSQSVTVTVSITAAGNNVNEGTLTIPVIVAEIITVTRYTSTGTAYQAQETIYKVVPETVQIPSSPYQFTLNLPAGMTVGTYALGFSYSDPGGIYASSSDTETLTVTAPSFVVTTLADNADATPDCASGTGSTCSLRDAITLANTAGGGNITFASGLASVSSPGTILLGTGSAGDSGLPAIAGAINITGPGANQLTVSGNQDANVGSVFTVESGATVTIYGLTIANGYITASSGAGINNAGTLTLTACAISGNAASHLGAGGILNSGTLTVTDSTVSANRAHGDGGGISSPGTLMVEDSTISGNSSLGGNGGGIAGGTLTVLDTTVSGNSAASGSGGGIEWTGVGTATISNSIVAGNTASTGQDAYNSAGTFTDGGYNLIGVSGAGSGNTGFSASTTLTGTTANPLNPNLAALGNYGGPTQTMIPLPGSAAICAGSGSLASSASVTADQRGVALNAGGYCASGSVDAGAVQTDYALSFTASGGVQPTNVVQNAAMSPAPAVTLTESGTPFTASPVTIPLTLTSTPSGATLTGGSAATSAGVATYTGLSVNQVGTGDTLTATLALNPAITPTAPAIAATSTSFNVAPAVTQLAFSAAPPATLSLGGNAGTVTVQEENSSGALVTTATDSITLTVTGPNSYSQTYTATAVNGVATFSLGSAALNAAGGYTYVASSGSYTEATATETVDKGTATVTLGSLSQTYTGSPLSATATTNPTGLAVDFTYNGSTTAPTAAGSYTVVGTISDANYQGSATGTLVIGKATATVTLGSLSQTYTGSPLSATATTSPTGLTVDFTYNGSATAPTAAGSYAVTGTISDANYQGSATGTLVIGKASLGLSVTSSPAKPVYGTLVTLSGTVSPAISEATASSFSFQIDAGTGNSALVPAATYSSGTVTATYGQLKAGAHTAALVFSGTADYAASTSSAANIEVDQAAPTIAWTPAASLAYGNSLAAQLDATSSYGGSSVPGAFTYTAQLAGGAAVPVTGSTVLAAGAYKLTASFTPTDTTDYKTESATSPLTVTKAALTASADDATRVYGTANPAFSGSVTGAVNGDTFTESFSTAATQSSSVGTYPIVPSVTGTDLSDYALTTENGTLTITQAASTTALSLSSTSITPGQSVKLTAAVTDASAGSTGTPTGKVSFYDGTTLLDTATLSGGMASYSTTALSAGTTHELTAVYEGDDNFTGSSTSSAVSVVVAPLDFTMTLSGPSSATVEPGGSISYTVKVDPLYGSYAGTVNFAVSGLPTGATTTFSPASIPSNGGPQTVTVTITFPRTSAANHPPSAGQRLAPVALAVLLLPFAGGLRRRGRKLSGLVCLLLLALAGVAATAGLTGCGAANGYFAQPQKSYTVTLTATAGNLTHTATVTVDVE